MIPFFTLYGLIGCPHCEEAEKYLKVRGIPVHLVIANDDPVADQGIEKIFGIKEYPVLVDKRLKQLIKGFKKEEYERIADDFYSFASTNTGSVFSSPASQPQAEPVQTAQPA